MGSFCTKISRLGSPGALKGASLKPGGCRSSPVGSLCMWPLKLALFSLPVPYLPLGLELTLFGDLLFALVLCGLCDLGAEASIRIPAGTAPALPGALQGVQGLPAGVGTRC